PLNENLARALHLRPAAIEFGGQRRQCITTHSTIERGSIDEFATRLMQRGIVHAPEPPRLLDAERLDRVGQMLPVIPRIKRFALGRIGNGGADDEIGYRHWRSPSREAP